MVCVLQPDYGSSEVDYRNYDPPRNLSHLLPEAQVDHIFLNKLTAYRQLKALKREGYDIFINLCEGYPEWDIPSFEVIHALEMLDLPYTGPSPQLYDPPKPLMKYVAFAAGVAVPDFAVVHKGDDVASVCAHLSFPLFVKPAGAGDSLGIDEHSLVHSMEELEMEAAAIAEEFDTALVEAYIEGREFTVLVVAGEPEPVAYLPLEFEFSENPPFKTYDLKVTQWHPERNVPCTDPGLDGRLRDAAIRVFAGFEGVGYARMDFRVDAAGEIYFLEVNFTCSVFYPEGYEGSADYILQFDGAGQSGFLRQIIAEGVARHRRKKKNYLIRGNTVDGFGLSAARDIKAGEVIWKGEERMQRVATLSHVETNWPAKDQETFRRYAYPVSDEVFILWSADPSEWAPQNHSCAPNTAFSGLNILALRDIAAGEELTLDYTTFYDEHMEPFECHCGAANCRGWIRGVPGNTLTKREVEKRK
ncbi:MAG: SET domain-containing protein-lysine N-methyltransferase [Lewinellaceae bacterium]|nr:SET domain-containing protein-lysine N-methyltransferase [Lewinellaceae bacterium]